METMTVCGLWIPGLFLSVGAIGMMYAETVRARTLALSVRKSHVGQRRAVSVAAYNHKKPQLATK